MLMAFSAAGASAAAAMNPSAVGPVRATSASTVEVTRAPELLKKLTPEPVEAVFPAQARRDGTGGKVMVGCTIDVRGVLKDCAVVLEDPPGKGFGTAALRLMPAILFQPMFRNGQPAPRPIRLRIGFVPPAMPKRGGPGYAPPQWLKKPTDSDMQAVWPVGGRAGGLGLIGCEVNIHGLLDDCTAVSEDPLGSGFGAAALRLASGFLFRPAQGPDGPFASRVRIPIRFTASPGLAMRARVLMVGAGAIWTEAPSFEDLQRVDSKRRAGHAVIRCAVTSQGRLRDCIALSETPRGTGSSATRLAGKFRMRLAPESIKSGLPVIANVPFYFPDPEGPDFKTHRLERPTWTTALKESPPASLFPSRAAAKGVDNGIGAVRCEVGLEGFLSDCAALPGEPAGLGFSDAAATLASHMQVDPWTEEGAPVDGATVGLRIGLSKSVGALRAVLVRTETP
ncbi:MAG: TonB family protein [Caulobacteraceae bacterium]